MQIDVIQGNQRMAQSKTLPIHYRRHFYHHLLRALMLAGALVVTSLGIGIAGYHFIAGLNWVDALLNAAMILSGMGPIDPLRNDAAKIFAALFALYSGLVIIGVAGVLLAPMFHRVLHKFHIEQRDA